MKFLTVEQLLDYATISVNEAAYVASVSRSTAYKLVEDDQFFETVVIRGRLRVLTRPLYRKLMGSVAHDSPETALEVFEDVQP